MALLLSVLRSDMCLNLFCLTTVMWMFQLCHQFFPQTCYVSRMSVASLLSWMWMFQLCHLGRPVMCQNFYCLSAVSWMFQLCHQLFPNLLCDIVSECLLPYCCRVNVPSMPSLVPWPLMCQNFCCPKAVMWMFQLCRHLFPDLLCQNVCCLTAVTWFSKCAISCSQTCYVSECLLPHCCHMNVPTVPLLVPASVMFCLNFCCLLQFEIMWMSQ